MSPRNEAVEDVIKWMAEFVEVPHPALGGWAPCPFARRARLQQRVRFLESDGPGLGAVVRQAMHEFERSSFDVAVIVEKHVPAWPLEKFLELFAELKDEGRELGFHLMRDHPADEECVNGVRMNHGGYILVFVQSRELLESATADLKRAGYYDRWPEESFDVVVGSRA